MFVLVADQPFQRAGVANPFEENSVASNRLLQLHTPWGSTVRACVRYGERDRRLRHTADGIARTRPNDVFVGFPLSSDGVHSGRLIGLKLVDPAIRHQG